MIEIDKEKNKKTKMLDNFRCPLSQMIMADPVVATDGHTYEREWIERHLLINGNNKSPLINSTEKDQLLQPTFIPNNNLRSQIDEFVKQNREYEEEYNEQKKAAEVWKNRAKEPSCSRIEAIEPEYEINERSDQSYRMWEANPEIHGTGINEINDPIESIRSYDIGTDEINNEIESVRQGSIMSSNEMDWQNENKANNHPHPSSPFCAFLTFLLSLFFLLVAFWLEGNKRDQCAYSGGMAILLFFQSIRLWLGDSTPEDCCCDILRSGRKLRR